MNIKELKFLATRFRSGIEKAYEQNLFRSQPFNDFPNACCGDAPELLAQYYMDNGLKQDFKYKTVHGTYRYDDFENIFSHSWLVVNDTCIVDITADQRQFKNKKIFPQDAVKSCYVGAHSEFHSLFGIDSNQCREFYGLRNLGDYSYNRMKKIYDVIITCID